MSHKNLQGLVSHGLTAYLSVFNLFLTQWIMAILSKGLKPDDFEPHNTLNLALQVFEAFSNFVDCESFLESNSPDISCSTWDKLGWLSWYMEQWPSG